MTNSIDQDARTMTIVSPHGRDNGKAFRINEVPPLDMAPFILRLLGAIRLSGINELTALVKAGSDADTVSIVLRLLAGSDASAVKSLLDDALRFVEIAPDPRHPGAFRALHDADIRELKTLYEIIGAFAKHNVTSGL